MQRYKNILSELYISARQSPKPLRGAPSPLRGATRINQHIDQTNHKPQNVQVSAVQHFRHTQHVKEHWNNATNDEKTSEKITATSPKRPSLSRSSPPTYSAPLTALEQLNKRRENDEKTSEKITETSKSQPFDTAAALSTTYSVGTTQQTTRER